MKLLAARQHTCMAGMRGLDEQLRFLDKLMRAFGRPPVAAMLVRREEVLSELASRKRVEEKLRVVELLAEPLHHRIRLLGDRGHYLFHHRGGAVEHGLVRAPRSPGSVACLQRKLSFEGLTLAGGQRELES